MLQRQYCSDEHRRFHIEQQSEAGVALLLETRQVARKAVLAIAAPEPQPAESESQPAELQPAESQPAKPQPQACDFLPDPLSPEPVRALAAAITRERTIAVGAIAAACQVRLRGLALMTASPLASVAAAAPQIPAPQACAALQCTAAFPPALPSLGGRSLQLAPPRIAPRRSWYRSGPSQTSRVRTLTIAPLAAGTPKEAPRFRRCRPVALEVAGRSRLEHAGAAGAKPRTALRLPCAPKTPLACLPDVRSETAEEALPLYADFHLPRVAGKDCVSHPVPVPERFAIAAPVWAQARAAEGRPVAGNAVGVTIVSVSLHPPAMPTRRWDPQIGPPPPAGAAGYRLSDLRSLSAPDLAVLPARVPMPKLQPAAARPTRAEAAHKTCPEARAVLTPSAVGGPVEASVKWALRPRVPVVRAIGASPRLGDPASSHLAAQARVWPSAPEYRPPSVGMPPRRKTAARAGAPSPCDAARLPLRASLSLKARSLDCRLLAPVMALPSRRKNHNQMALQALSVAAVPARSAELAFCPERPLPMASAPLRRVILEPVKQLSHAPATEPSEPGFLRTHARSAGIAAAIGLAAALAVGIAAPRLHSGAGWRNFQQTLQTRAAIALSDDFHGGMAAWTGEKDWGRTWSYDQAGFVRTGHLVLWRPTLPLADYTFEFYGQIDQRAFGWVFRATDLRNYYATKIAISKPGPLPKAVIQRYAVIGGRKTPVSELPLPMAWRNDGMYHVQVSARGANFVTSVEGQVVDSWSDTSLKTGGVGLFSDPGELARIQWVRLAHQDDFLGRLASFLSPQQPIKEKEQEK